ARRDRRGRHGADGDDSTPIDDDGNWLAGETARPIAQIAPAAGNHVVCSTGIKIRIFRVLKPCTDMLPTGLSTAVHNPGGRGETSVTWISTGGSDLTHHPQHGRGVNADR